MPTLAELRANSGAKSLPMAQCVVTLIEGQHLLTESRRLENERLDLILRAERDAEAAEDDGRKRTQKAGQKAEPSVPPRVEEITAELAALVDRLAEFQGTVDLRGITGGEWQRFKDDHPPREDNMADLQVAKGHCDSSALFGQLGRFVVSWNGEEVAANDWDDWLAEKITYADRRDMVTAVVDMHEANLPRISPKSPTGSSPTEDSATD